MTETQKELEEKIRKANEQEEEKQAQSSAQNAINALNSHIHDDMTKNFVVVAFIRNGFISKDSLAQASQTLTEMAQKEKVEREKAQKASEEQLRQFNDPEVVFPRMVRERHANPKRLIKWKKSQPDELLLRLLHTFESNPQHWNSVFHGQIHEAMSILKSEIRTRQSNRPQEISNMKGTLDGVKTALKDLTNSLTQKPESAEPAKSDNDTKKKVDYVA